MKSPTRDSDDWHLTDDLHAEQGKGDPFAAAIRATRMAMLITDPRQPDNPIVFANNAFLRLTGYSRQEVVGNNCRFLQGPDTDPLDVAAVRDAIREGRDINVDILNYKKDGTPFWNALYISPVVNEDGELQFFFASQLDVTDRKTSEHRVHAEKERFEAAVKARTSELETALEAQNMLMHEIDHRVKNNLQMISSLIVMQSRAIPDEAIRNSLRAMLERVEALSTVHRRLYQSDDVTRFDISEFVRDLVRDLVASAGGDRIKTNLDLKPVEIPAEKAAAVSLMINELITNAIKHGFSGERNGSLDVKVAPLENGRFVVEITDDGQGMGPDTDPKGFGLNLIRALGRQLKADIEWKDAAPGTLVRIVLPVDAAAKEA